MRVSGKAGLMIILAAGGLGFIIALAGSPGIGSPKSSEDEIVYVSAVIAKQPAEDPE